MIGVRGRVRHAGGDPPPLIEGPGHQGFELVELSRVTRDGDRLAAVAGVLAIELRGHRLAGVRLAARHHHLRPRSAEAGRDRLPDAPGGAGDDGDAITQVERVHAQLPSVKRIAGIMPIDPARRAIVPVLPRVTRPWPPSVLPRLVDAGRSAGRDHPHPEAPSLTAARKSVYLGLPFSARMPAFRASGRSAASGRRPGPGAARPRCRPSSSPPPAEHAGRPVTFQTQERRAPMSNRPARVQVTEVGTRDGFQAEPKFIPTGAKVRIINDLVAAGVPRLEYSSFMSPRAVPQLADSVEVLREVDRGATMMGLIANAKGARRGGGRRRGRAGGGDLGLREPQPQERQPGCRGVPGRLRGGRGHRGRCERAGARRDRDRLRLPVRGRRAVRAGGLHREAVRAARLPRDRPRRYDRHGDPAPRHRLTRYLRDRFPETPIALHFHNTRGIGLCNVMAGLDEGIDRFESSIGGLGGCPFAPERPATSAPRIWSTCCTRWGSRPHRPRPALRGGASGPGDGGSSPSRTGHEGRNPCAPARPRRGAHRDRLIGIPGTSPGVLAKMGFGPRRIEGLNPRLIGASVFFSSWPDTPPC